MKGKFNNGLRDAQIKVMFHRIEISPGDIREMLDICDFDTFAVSCYHKKTAQTSAISTGAVLLTWRSGGRREAQAKNLLCVQMDCSYVSKDVKRCFRNVEYTTEVFQDSVDEREEHVQANAS
eukprot:gnl/MRDRNA2_/MRDRNA2_296289_c0_seq1.p2 gnl/MRDRNA2_/MRDRNA2_296289_c0~~gnl/MRDRNA2_/MRDRNA2_296289_c0_seq1.p2  ORF type:complete len:122 (+),score=19.72 gnl/MRDRNA2_/MRDRNA2_296289_c0_seq1:213-578(+)